MVIPMLAVVALTLAQPGPVEVCESAVIAQVRAGIEQLRGSPQARGDGVRTAVYEGTASVEAHLARPHQVLPRQVRIEVAFDATRLAVRETTLGRAPTTETTLMVGERIATQASAEAPFRELAGAEADRARGDALRWLPHPCVQSALAAAKSLRPGAAVDWRGSSLSPLTFSSPGANACTIFLDSGHRVLRIESLAADQRLGDVCEWTAFGYEREERTPADAPADLPTRLDRFVVGGSVTVTYSLSLAAARPPAEDDSWFSPPADRKDDLPSWSCRSVPPSGDITFRRLDEGLYAAELPSANERVLVVERDHDLVVLEAPDGDGTCGSLLRELDRRFPGKGVGMVAFGHHHPSYTGGLRAFAARGAAIITQRDLEPFIRLILGRPTSLGGQTVAAPADPLLTVYDAEFTIEAGDNSVRLIDIGELSGHTEHYTIFYFPGRRLLFEGDLGFFPADGPPKLNPRLAGLIKAVDQHQLRPVRLLQAWPLRGVRPEVEWESVKALTPADHKPEAK